MEYILTKDIASELKCSLCELALSVSPVSIISEDATKYKCGRCHPIKTHIETRCYMYEKLAKHMIFPCAYDGCEQKLKWSDVKAHEKTCAHRKLMCPTLNCDDKIGINDFINHFKEKHKECYHENKVVVHNVHNYYSLDLLEKDGKAYVIIFSYNDILHGISVCALEDDNHQYELIIDSDSSRQSIIASEQRIVPFDEKTHCFKCVTGICKSEFHLFQCYKNGVLKRMTTKLDRSFVQKTFRGWAINYHINIVDEKVDVDEDLDDLVNDMVVDEVNDDEEEEELEVSKDEETVKHLLECPSCHSYMQSPMYQCLTGHTVCGKCKEKAEKCTKCEAAIENTRNYALEEFASNLKIPLQSETRNEPIDKEITCPLVHCSEKFHMKDILGHFKGKHLDHYHWGAFKLKNIYSYFDVHFLMKGNGMYLILLDYNIPNFGICLCSITGPDDAQYEVRLTSHDGKFTLAATDQKIIEFDDAEHCFKCITGTCKDDKHKYRLTRRTLLKRFTTKLSRESIYRMLGHKNVNYTVTIIDRNKVFQKELMRKKDRIFRQLYECPICKDYMLPPIHQCTAGHVLCNTCKGKVEKCPSCEGAYTGTRNCILEEIVENIILPCQFVTERCPFRAGVKRIASHEAECPLNKKRCPEPEKKSEVVEKTE